MRKMDQVNLTLDEFEAIRLADLQGLYQEEAAIQMQISRQTFGRIVTEAHKKIADALINGKVILMENPFDMNENNSELRSKG